ncbi:MAG: alpha/beta hydrolase-fold protein [Planctomycetota bacterium]
MTPRSIVVLLAALLLFSGLVPRASAQDAGLRFVVTDASGTANPDQPIHLAGNFNNWNPGDPAHRLIPTDDGRWQIQMPWPTNVQDLSFKFALGDWDRVEVDVAGEDITNRMLRIPAASKRSATEPAVFEFTVAGFSPETEPIPERILYKLSDDRELDITGDVERLETAGGGGPASDFERTALVWLPPGYTDPANASRRYPVLYLLDGQNVFEKLPWLAGEWGADETAQRLIEAGEVEPFIMVAIPHAGRARMSEYQALPVYPNSEAAGPQFLRWLISNVMPDVNERYRTMTGREHTAIGGASLGGTMSLFAGAQHPDVFGLVLIESPPLIAGALQWDSYLRTIERWPERVYVGVGGKETGNHPSDARRNQQYVQGVRSLRGRLQSAGLRSDRLLVVIDEDAFHNEAAWAERFPDAIRFLFGK